MTWDNGPWAIEGGQTSADVGRLVAWHAVDGAVGVGTPTDLRVRALDVPGGQVVVGPGTCSVPVNALGKMFQSYIGSNPDDDSIDIPATGASARSDLIVARVENPITGEPWLAPDDPLTGQYIFTRRYPGVASDTTHVGQVDPSASAITLARIDIPPSTGAITDAMIVDLRKTIAAPLDAAATYTDTTVFTVDDVLPPPPNIAGHQESAWVNWPSLATWNVPVPTWATTAELYYSLNPAISGNTWGHMQFLFNGRASTYTSFDVNFPKDSVAGENIPFTNAGGMRTTYVAGAKVNVLAAERGTTIPVRVQAKTFSNQNAYAARGSSGVGRGAVGYLSITFKKAAAAS